VQETNGSSVSDSTRSVKQVLKKEELKVNTIREEENLVKGRSSINNKEIRGESAIASEEAQVRRGSPK
jgi:hypothetical protein